MGFFGGSTTYVSSTLYNMAGPEIDRSSYSKTLIISNVIGPADRAFSETITQGYLHGPGIRLRSFFRWANTPGNYDEIGVPKGTFGSSVTIDPIVLAGQIPSSAGHTVKIQRIRGGTMDYSYWSEQWMMEHHPDLLDTEWSSDISNTTNEITILFADESTATFMPVIDRNAKYIYAVYSLVDTSSNDWGTAKMFIYKLGSGNTVLDAAVDEHVDDGEYVPFIPLRLDNKFMSETFLPAGFAQAKKAYKKSLGSRTDGYAKIIDKLKENENLNDIDYAYVMFGVPLNVHGKESRQYLFRFFERCMGNQSVSQGEYATDQAAREAYETANETWQTWKIAQVPPPSTIPPTEPDPLYGTPEPPRPVQTTALGSEVVIKADGTVPSNVNMKISWGAITKTTGTGLKDPANLNGSITFKTLAGLVPKKGGILSDDKVINVSQLAESVIEITWQKSLLHWETLTINGLIHENLIYNKKAVTIGANEALNDTDDSGFLVPFHMDIVHQMNLVNSTQMMSAGVYVVLNSYQVVKQKWYQTGFFKLIVFIAIIAITIATGGAGATTGGLLGTAASVGAAVGLNGLLGVIVGLVINQIAAMILQRLFTLLGNAIFGPKFGAIFAAIVGILAISFATGGSAGMSLNQIVSSLSSVQNLIAITNSIGEGVAGYINAQSMEIVTKTQELMDKTKKELDEISRRYAQEFGYGRAEIDPLSLTDTKGGNFAERRDDFLTRTLLTGSDIAQMSIDMMVNYPRYSLELESPR